MTATLTTAEVLRLRLRAQRLCVPLSSGHPAKSGEDATVASASAALASTAAAQSGPERIADVARHILALQGQDWRSSQWALGVRAPGTTRDDVRDAFNHGSIVRSWPMRGTIHVVAAEDIGWMQTLTNRRPLAGAAKRREYLGIDDATLERLVDAAVQALQNGGTLNRDELSQVWTDAGIAWQSNWRYHLIWWLCQNGIAVLGPVDGDEPRIALAADWISSHRTLTGDDALIEFASRYAAARGPVQVQDLAWWGGLTRTEVKRAFALAAESGRLQQIDVRDDSERTPGDFWCAPELLGQDTGSTPEAPDDPAWLMLPAFDEHLLGYTDRSAQLDPDHFERIVPGRNGMFLATVVHRGRTVGTWKRAGTAKRPAVQVTPLPGVRLGTEDFAVGLSAELTRWATFHQLGDLGIIVREAR